MLDENLMREGNIISLAEVRARRQDALAQPLRARVCRHCCAVLGEGENEDECSSAGFSAQPVAPLARRLAE